MSEVAVTDARWDRLASFSETFTCYSAAMATWAASAAEDWARMVNPGLWLTITSPGGGIFGFGYFPASLRAELGLVRAGGDLADEAVEAVLGEIQRSGRVIVAGDGFNLPWHVAHGRRHVPHWFVLEPDGDRLAMLDAFAARNDLGLQEATRLPLAHDELPPLLAALPEDDPVYRLREILAFGDDTAPLPWHAHQWFVQQASVEARRPEGADGPDGLRVLAGHFREHGQDPAAYAQADDIWSIGRHRAFLCRVVEENADDLQRAWLDEHALPLAKRWGHIAPLLMQATLALTSGRPASASLPDVLDELADREAAAAAAFPGDRSLIRV